MITQEEVKRYLDYNPDTGIFRWKDGASRKMRGGAIAGDIGSKRYISIGINNRSYQAHRLAWLYVYGEMPKSQIDHINRIRNDNRIANLREVDFFINNRNKGLQRNNKSGYSGIKWCSRINRWEVQIGGKKTRKYLGCFKTLNEAIKKRTEYESLLGYIK